MTVTVKLFAILKDRAGTGELALELPPGATVARAGEAIGERLPAIRGFLPRVAYAVNRSYAKPDAPLSDGDELAVIPPVSGG
jgi:molybdopterin synthase catalytic subunit